MLQDGIEDLNPALVENNFSLLMIVISILLNQKKRLNQKK
jgi:hypothetical protein